MKGIALVIGVDHYNDADNIIYDTKIRQNNPTFLKNLALNKSLIDNHKATKGFFLLKNIVGA